MTKPCPQCGGSHFTELQYKAYFGETSSSTLGLGLMESDGIPFLVCLCGWPIGPPSPAREPALLICDSVRRTWKVRAAREDSMRDVAGQKIARDQLENCKENLRLLSKLVDAVIGNRAKDAK